MLGAIPQPGGNAAPVMTLQPPCHLGEVGMRTIKRAEPAWMARTTNQRKARHMRRQRHAAGDRHAFA